MFGLFKKKRNTEDESFWTWFISNATAIENFIDAEKSDYSIYHTLTKKMQQYNPILVPELTKTKDNKYVLIITPDGRKDGVQPTKDLYSLAPEIPNWEIVKFRQSTDNIQLNYDGIEFPAEDIQIIYKIDRDREVADIQVFIRNMDKDERGYQALAFLYLDHILGEFNTITRVGYIDFYNLTPTQYVKNSISILEFREVISRELY